MDDSSLAARARSGDRAAFDALVERHYAACTRLAWRLLGRRQDAEDAVQEAFLRAWRAIGRYEEQRCFRAWLMRILVNRCRTSGARRSRRRSVSWSGGWPGRTRGGDTGASKVSSSVSGTASAQEPSGGS